MTREEYLRGIIGDLALRVATLAAEVDALKAELVARPAPQPPNEQPDGH